MSARARVAFAAIAGVGLFRSGHALYRHQQEMLTEALAGKHCVVVTGTGSGKTEAFLLPVLATIVREAIDGPGWRAAPGHGPTWSVASPPAWDVSRREARGETRSPAVRALILYPMNALVEDRSFRGSAPRSIPTRPTRARTNTSGEIGSGSVVSTVRHPFPAIPSSLTARPTPLREHASRT